MNIYVLQCGNTRVDPTVPYGKRLDLLADYTLAKKQPPIRI